MIINIAYTEETMEVLVTTFNMIDLIELTVDPELAEVDVKKMESTVVSDKFVEGLDVLPNEVFFAGWPAMYDSLMKVKHDSSIVMHTTAKEYKLDFIGLNDEPVIPFISQTVAHQLLLSMTLYISNCKMN